MIRKFFRLLSILVLCAALFFGYQTLEWSNKYKQGHDEYEKLQAQNTPENESTPENDSDSTKELPFCPDWTALKAENPDIVGWIRMDPTCDYPIMQAQDNDYYLYKGFGRSYNINGSIFLSSVNSSDFSDKNSIVYGHNMRNGDMFGDNDYYHEKSYCLEHPYFWIYRENGQYTYRIFDVMRVTDATEAYDTQFASDDDFETYLNDMKNQSSYTIPDAWPSKTDHIVSLSTCVAAHGSTRMIIQGKLVNITDYSGDDIPLTSLTTQNQNSNDTPDSSKQQ